MKPAGLIARGAYDDDAERTRKTVCRQCKTVCRGIRRCLLREMLPRRRHIQVFRVLCEGKIHHPSRWAENCCSWDSGPCWSAVFVLFTSRPLSPCCCSQAMRWPRSPTLCACMRASVCAIVSSKDTPVAARRCLAAPHDHILCSGGPSSLSHAFVLRCAGAGSQRIAGSPHARPRSRRRRGSRVWGEGLRRGAVKMSALSKKEGADLS